MIHALPGMGADHRMYPGPWLELPDFVAHDWVRHSGESSLAEIADSMCLGRGIVDGDIIIGSSLGGMVGCEIAKIRKLKSLFLVGSATSKNEVGTALAMLRRLLPLTPLEWIRGLAGTIPNEVAQMFSGIEASFLRAMCQAVFEWEGPGQCATPMFRIHGRHDYIIPALREVDLLVDGGHLISMTHPRECAEFVRLKISLNGAQ